MISFILRKFFKALAEDTFLAVEVRSESESLSFFLSLSPFPRAPNIYFHNCIFKFYQAFFPKNRGNWKQYSTWEPEEKDKKSKINEVDNMRFPPDVQIKKGYSWSDQLGIAIAVLVEANQTALVNWTLEVSKLFFCWSSLSLYSLSVSLFLCSLTHTYAHTTTPPTLPSRFF